MSYRKKKFPHPYFIDHDSKWIYIYVASGWPACYALSYWKREYFYEFEGYGASLCKEEALKSMIKAKSLNEIIQER